MLVVDESVASHYAAEEHGEDDSNDMEVGEGAIHWCTQHENVSMATEMIDCLCDLGAYLYCLYLYL